VTASRPSRRASAHAAIAPAMAPRLLDALGLIAAGRGLPHSGTSLRAHLLGTCELLQRWGADPDVCLAGLLHSIYSTQYFRAQVAPQHDRTRVARIVGEHPERIADLFCRLDRPALRDAVIPASGRVVAVRQHDGRRSVRISRRTLCALRLIDIANEVEQRQRQALPQRPWLAWACGQFATIGVVPARMAAVPAIDERRERRMLALYRAALGSDARQRRARLRRCTTLVPDCAEPRLLLSLLQLREGAIDAAYVDAARAVDALDAWGAAWDARVPLVAWRLLGAQLMEAARTAAPAAPALGSEVLERLRRLERDAARMRGDPA
jgi:hypothetical protein